MEPVLVHSSIYVQDIRCSKLIFLYISYSCTFLYGIYKNISQFRMSSPYCKNYTVEQWIIMIGELIINFLSYQLPY